ncbi:DsbA family protein [Oceanibaculum pacificum]|uniref:Disulfide bond formation protein DsbA n=1 Tax=Oceanibaculum pacificum TaxID=580166 RepID=A0A154WGB1_9PROT|nr:DsbA family protein [Oceanibaculum pacificum]KZD12495.1 disulfide bond formation protein DsbA [Oceanibaculum pacificum]
MGVVVLGWSLSAAAQQSLEEMLAPRILGNADAPVEILEFSSMTCPHCGRFHRETLGQIKKNFIDTGKVKLVLRDFPFDGLALRASMLARCAPPERYHAFVETLYHNQDAWSRAADPMAALAQIAKLGGMNQQQFEACMADEKLLDGILQGRLEAQNKYNITSTPTFVIRAKGEEKTISGAQPYEEFEKVLKPLVDSAS